MMAVREKAKRSVGNQLVERVGADEYRYALNDDGTARIVGCKPGSREISIPEKLGQFTVSELADTSFAQKLNVECIRCPRGLRHIGERAFQGCMHLQSIVLNEGLESIGEEAFFLCPALSQVRLPRTVRGVGVNVMGARGNQWRYQDNARFVSDSPNVIVAEDGLVYQRNETGLTLVDGTRFGGTVLLVDERTTCIGQRALAMNANVECVVLPEGVTSIGEAAFRGCTALARVELPSTLREIGQAAFSCSGVKSISLPRACTDLAPYALVTGPVQAGCEVRPFASALERVSVEDGNPVYVERGGVLCRRLGDGRLEAVLCPGGVADVELGSDVVRVCENAFAGATGLASLKVHEGVGYEGSEQMLPHGVAGHVVIELDEARDEFGSVEFDVPSGQVGKRFTSSALSAAPIDVEALLAAYDAALAKTEDRLEQAMLVIARLARPTCLADKTRVAFEQTVRAELSSICVHFGARNYWRGFDELVACGVLDREGLCAAIDVLSAMGDGTAVGYLLELQQRHFAEAMWDYDL